MKNASNSYTERKLKCHEEPMVSFNRIFKMFVSLNHFLWMIIVLVSCVDCEKKIWTRAHKPEWMQTGSNTKCAESKAVHAKHVDGLMYLKDAQEVTDFILPKDGVIVLLDNSQMGFVMEPGCERSTDHMIFNYSNAQKWFSAESWTTYDEEFNAAKSHIFRIPCECDTISIVDSGFSIDLDMVDEIAFDQFIIQGKVCDSDQDMTEFLLTKSGQKMFTNSDAVQFVKGFCNPQRYCGCHNHRRFEKYKELLCLVEQQQCEVPHCLEPIQPAGHCCPMCGATLDFKLKDSCDFNMTKLQMLTANKLARFRNGKHEKKIHFHAGMVPGKKRDDNIAQLVVTEVGEYTSISVEFMNFITKDEHFQEDFNRLKTVSGMPYVPGKNSLWLIVFMTLLFVLSVYTMLYVHYVREPSYQNWVPISRFDILRKSVAFARFDNRHHDEDDENERIDVGVKFDGDGKLIEKTVTDFNNPLFQSEPIPSGSSEQSAAEIGLIETSILNIGNDIEMSLTSGSVNLIDVNLNADEED